VTEDAKGVHMTRHQVTPSHALISKFFNLLLLDSSRPKGLFIPPVDVIVSSASLLSVVLVITIVVSVSPVLVLVIIVASPVSIEVVVVESLLLMLLLVAMVLIVLLLVMLQMMLKTLLQLLLIGQARRISELLLMLLLHLGRLLLTLLLLHLMLLALSVSHAGVVEVMHGGVDVSHVTSIHGHGLWLLLLMHRRPRTSKHHLGLYVSETLHPRDGGRGELWPVSGLLLELRRLLPHHLHLLMLLRRS